MSLKVLGHRQTLLFARREAHCFIYIRLERGEAVAGRDVRRGGTYLALQEKMSARNSIVALVGFHRYKIVYIGVSDCFKSASILLIILVGERGFEPPTPWSRTRCSTRLSHSPNMVADACHRALPGAFFPSNTLQQV